MGILASSEKEVKDKICEMTLKPMAILANALGVAWAGGCGSYVGEGFDRTSEGWQARYNGCGGYRSMDRLFIKYSDWKIEFKDVILLGQPMYRDWDPLIYPITLDNYESSTPIKLNQTVAAKRVSETTDTKGTEFTFGQEVSMSFGVRPPSATGGPESSKGFKLTFGQKVTNGHQQKDSFEVIEQKQIEKQVPPGCLQKGEVSVTQIKASQEYSAVFRVSFAIRIGGFLKWGGNDRNSPDTNYHKDFAGTDRRPWVEQFSWGKWGNDRKSFPDDLRDKIQGKGDHNPWEWDRLFRQHPEAREAVDFLTNAKNYEFELKGKLENLSGTEVRVKFVDEKWNPRYQREIAEYHRRLGKASELALPEGLVLPPAPPAFLNQDMQI